MDEQKPNAKEAWDRMSGVAPEQGDVPNYLKEMLVSNVSLQTGLSAVAVGAVLSLVFGAGFLLIPPLLAGGGAAIAALFVPSSPVFRAKVDRQKRAERRERVRIHLREKIEAMAPYGGSERHYHTVQSGKLSRQEYDTYMQTYERMVQRLDALRKLADDSGAALTEHDVEKLDETTVDFLRLMHARMLVLERLGTDTSTIEHQLESLDKSIDDAETAVDRRRLEQARDGLGRILKSRARLPARDAALRAQLLTMGEAYEDLYHRINADPSAGVSEYLMEATSRLSIEEELSLAVDDEMDELHKARQAKRARERA